jgi:hypothetical protein
MVGSWDHPHKRFQALQTDKIFVWSASLKREALELQSYVDENVIVVGAPHADYFADTGYIIDRGIFFRKHGLEPEKKLITLFSGTGRAPDEGDIVAMLLAYANNPHSKHRIQILVRSYPGDKEGDLLKFGSFEGKGAVAVDWLEDGAKFGSGPLAYFPNDDYMRNFVSLFFHSEIVLSVYSSASVEASIFSKPTINIAFDGYNVQRRYGESVKRFELQSHFDKLFSTGAVTNVTSEKELYEAVEKILSTPGYKQQEITTLRESVCGITDGHSNERMFKHIKACLDGDLPTNKISQSI